MKSYNLDLTTFCKLARQFDAIPVCRTLLSDSLTPVSAFQRIDDGKTACLFESVVGGERVGRFSFLASKPIWTLKAWANEIKFTRNGSTEEKTVDNPLEFLREKLGELKVPQLPGMPPFNGGAVGYAGYDVVRYVERLPNAPDDDRELPDLCFSFYDQMLVLDHIKKTLTALVLCRVGDYETPEAAFESATARVDDWVRELNESQNELQCVDIDPTARATDFEFQSNLSQEQFEDSVRKCVEYIQAGDVFQVVISQRLQMDIACDPLEIYRSLRVLNPSPFMFFLRTEECTLVGSSPEIMCRVEEREVTVRPLAGTRPRGKTDAEDRQLERSCLTIPRNALNMSCWSTWDVTMWAELPRSARSSYLT